MPTPYCFLTDRLHKTVSRLSLDSLDSLDSAEKNVSRRFPNLDSLDSRVAFSSNLSIPSIPSIPSVAEMSRQFRLGSLARIQMSRPVTFCNPGAGRSLLRPTRIHPRGQVAPRLFFELANNPTQLKTLW